MGELAARLGYRVPRTLTVNKGFIGQLAEVALGASAGSDPEPDFPALGVELKTLPVSPDGKPREATYICQARLGGDAALALADSYLMAKLQRILFLPILDTGESLPERRFGMPLLWTPTPGDLDLLGQDYAELQARIQLGQADDITTRDGVALHLRPKAVSSAERTTGRSEEGWLVPVRPKAWYLRTSFTHEILARHFRL